jgi:hypothetical protein
VVKVMPDFIDDDAGRHDRFPRCRRLTRELTYHSRRYRKEALDGASNGLA